MKFPHTFLSCFLSAFVAYSFLFLRKSLSPAQTKPPTAYLYLPLFLSLSLTSPRLPTCMCVQGMLVAAQYDKLFC
eukprot:m.9572 g.9572  ORF g.9572 m.9572 type:complete len:75 (-) comp2986_c0_seq1:767-991(-)